MQSIKLIRSSLGSKNLNRLFSTCPFTEDFASKGSKVSSSGVTAAAVYSDSLLPSGVRVITRQVTNEPTTAIQFTLNAGGRSELANEKGAAHLLSTAAFNTGSKRVSGLAMVRSLDTQGALISSSANRDKIVFNVEVASDHVTSVLGAALEAVFSPPANSYELQERQTVAAWSPPCTISELLHEAAYGSGSALGATSVDGSHVSLDAVSSFRQRNFVAGNLTVLASGGTGLHEEILKTIEKHVNDKLIPNGKAFSLTAQQQQFIGGAVKQRTDDDSVVAGVAFPVNNPKAAIVVNALLQKAGISSFIHLYSSGATGILGFTVNDNHTSGLAAAVKALKSIANGEFDAESITKSITIDNFRSLDAGGLSASNQLLAATILGGKPVAAVDFRSVSATDVSGAARSFLSTTPAYAILGSDSSVPTYDALRDLLK